MRLLPGNGVDVNPLESGPQDWSIVFDEPNEAQLRWLFGIAKQVATEMRDQGLKIGTVREATEDSVTLDDATMVATIKVLGDVWLRDTLTELVEAYDSCFDPDSKGSADRLAKALEEAHKVIGTPI